MKKLVLAFLIFTSGLVYGNCPVEFKSENLCAEIEWVNGPVLNELSSFEVTFWNKNDESKKPISPVQDVTLKSWMVMANGHSHGGPRITWEEVEEGIFLVEDARFFMGGMRGYWQVKVFLGSESQAFRVEFDD